MKQWVGLVARSIVDGVAGTDALVKFHTVARANQVAEGSAGVPDYPLGRWATQAGADGAAVTPMIEGKLQGGSPPSPRVAAEAVLAGTE